MKETDFFWIKDGYLYPIPHTEITSGLIRKGHQGPHFYFEEEVHGKKFISTQFIEKIKINIKGNVFLYIKEDLSVPREKPKICVLPYSICLLQPKDETFYTKYFNIPTFTFVVTFLLAVGSLPNLMIDFLTSIKEWVFLYSPIAALLFITITNLFGIWKLTKK